MEPRKMLKRVGKGVGAVASTIVDVAGGAAEVAGNVVEKGKSVMPGMNASAKKGTRRATSQRATASKAKSAPKASVKASATKAAATEKKTPTGKRTNQSSAG